MIEPTSERDARAFELYLAHQAVVYAAVWRTKLVRNEAEPLFADLAEEGMWLYREFYLQYQAPVETPEQIKQFNALAGKAITWRLLRYVERERSHHAIADDLLNDPAVNLREVTVPTGNVELAATLIPVYASLTPLERKVFKLLYERDLSLTEAAKRLHRTQARVSQIRRGIQAKYREVVEHQGEVR